MEPFKDIEVYRPYPYRPQQSLHIAARVAADRLIEDHSGESYFFTIGLGKQQKLSIEEEWERFGEVLQLSISKIMETLMIAGVVIGIEMYAKHRNQPNSKALRPHAHMVIFSYNNFLNFPVSEIEQCLIEQGLDFKLEPLATSQDIARATCYTIKSAKQKILNKATQFFYKTSPVAFSMNKSIQNNPLISLKNTFANNKISFQEYPGQKHFQYPSVSRFGGDQKLQIADFLNKLCVQEKIGFYKDKLMKVIEPARYTWAEHGKVDQFIHQIASVHGLPNTYRKALYNNASWILSEGNLKKTNHPVQIIFPRIKIVPHLWEFETHGVYNFLFGSFEEKLPDPFTSCSKFVRTRFDDLSLPDKIFKLLQHLLGPEDEQVMPFVVQLGSLFHPVQDRKEQNAIWVHGRSGTYKTWFIQKFLENNFNQLLISTVESGATQFQYGRLRGVTEGILFIDEFRSIDFPQPAKFLQVLDGQKVLLADKYEKAEISQFEGQAVLTSNQEILTTHYPVYDQDALSTRFSETEFTLSEDSRNIVRDLASQIKENDWISFGIYCNTTYLQTKFGKDSAFPDSWSTEENPVWILDDQNVEIIEPKPTDKEHFQQEDELFRSQPDRFFSESNQKVTLSDQNEEKTTSFGPKWSWGSQKEQKNDRNESKWRWSQNL